MTIFPHQKIAIEKFKIFLKTTEIVPFIKDILVFGSCSRGTQKYKSDVDIAVIIDDAFKKVPDCNKIVRKIRSDAEYLDNDCARIDLHIITHTTFNEHSTFNENIRKDGIKI